MNTNRIPETRNALGSARAQVEREFTTLRKARPHVLRLALNEAEAVALQTDFPHLLFPALAAEKAEALERWHRRQDALRQGEPCLAFAA